jgi:hypothetical protein
MYEFQRQRDKDGPDGAWSQWWGKHFAFFDRQTDAREYYDTWRLKELKLRKDMYSFRRDFDLNEYENTYALARSEYEERARVDNQLGKLSSDFQCFKDSFFRNNNSPYDSRSRFPPFKPSVPSNASNFSSSRPLFQQGSSGTSSAPAACILCAERGHTIGFHSSDKVTAKFSDGKAVWAKFNDGRLLTPDWKETASTSTSEASNTVSHRDKNIHQTDITSVLFAVKKVTTHSLGRADADPIKAFLNASRPPSLFYPDFLPYVIARPNFCPLTHILPDIFEAIVTPYNADAFDSFLLKHDLCSSYPQLTHHLRHGFPLGPMPELNKTNILKNHSSTTDNMKIIDEYLEEEVMAGRMSGPFSQQQAEAILRGPFQSSPLIVVFQSQGPGEPDKVRICRHLSKSSRDIPSVNSFIHKSDFPTRFDTAARVGDMVRLHLSYYFTIAVILHSSPFTSLRQCHFIFIATLPRC